eukprot:m.63570 g.63570  ORF g.63570 m.63570 type:complete len:175 (+) comp23303_c0_seq1:299-823(+)
MSLAPISILGDHPAGMQVRCSVDSAIESLEILRGSLHGKANKRARQKINDKVNKLKKSKSMMGLDLPQSESDTSSEVDNILASNTTNDFANDFVNEFFDSLPSPYDGYSSSSSSDSPPPSPIGSPRLTRSNLGAHQRSQHAESQFPYPLKRSSSAFEFGLDLDVLLPLMQPTFR